MTSDLRKYWSIFTSEERRKAAWMLVLVVLMAMAEAGGVVSIMPFLAVISRPAVIQENPLLRSIYDDLGFQDARSFIQALGLASIATVVVASAFKTITFHVLSRFIHFQRHSLSTRLLARYLNQPYEFFLTRNSSELAKNVLSEVDQILFNLIQPMMQLIAQGTVLLAMALLIFWYDAMLAVCTLVLLGLLYAIIYSLVRKRLARIGLERQEADQQRYQACSEALGGIKDVKITHTSSAYLEIFSRASRLFSRHMATNETLGQVPLYLVESLAYAAMISLSLLLLARSGDISHVLPALGLYGFAAYRMIPAAQVMFRGVARLKFSAAALEIVHRDMSLQEEEPAPAGEPLALQKEIRLDHIRYAYPSAPASPVFNDFSLVIPANTSIGIVGKSGTGKSTLMDLLLGLLQSQSGTLSVDGVRIDANNVASWQKAIGYVPQHIYLADATVAENIAFGTHQQDIDIKAVERAARAAQIHDFVTTQLREGYDTRVGDRGIRLSGGQRQRVGIARALYHDPQVLFFDEATSALDAQTEAELNEAIRNLSGRKTIVVIAHKEASLQFCARIVSIGSADSAAV